MNDRVERVLHLVTDSTSDLIFKLILHLDLAVDNIQRKVDYLDNILILAINLSRMNFNLHIPLVLALELLSVSILAYHSNELLFKRLDQFEHFFLKSFVMWK